MYKKRNANERGKSETDWLDSSHTFSFAEYYDLANMGFSDLRVINDDYVQPQMGFGLHPHNNMEILSVVLEGSLEHKDTMGNSEIIREGEIQKMTAGSGVFHSEYNPSKTDIVHFLQIWILPDRLNLRPHYETKAFDKEKMTNRLFLIASKEGKNGAFEINQDVSIYQAIIDKDMTINFDTSKSRKYWIQIALGEVKINTEIFKAGDGLAIMNESDYLEIKGIADKSNILLFDLRS